MTAVHAKPLEKLTMDEMDVILAQACAKAIAESFAEGVPIIYGDAERTYREWPDGRVEIVHDHTNPKLMP